MIETALLLTSGACAFLYGARWTLMPVSALRSGIKTASTLGLAMIAALSGLSVITAALVTGSAGDFFLSRRQETGFLPGLLAFAIGHILYIAVLFPLSGPIPPLGVAAIVALTIALLWQVWSALGALRVPVVFYAAISVLLGSLALSLPSELWLLRVGALMFILSDCILAIELFLLPDNHRLRPLASRTLWTLYWLAQAALLFGAKTALSAIDASGALA